MSNASIDEAHELTKDMILGLWPSLNENQVNNVLKFFENLVRENKVQNLTRLTSPGDFLEGHLIDVVELNKSGFLASKEDDPSQVFLDLGPGGGIPGLLSASVDGRNWLMVDAEGRKAEYLQKSADSLGLENVKAFAARIEHYLKEHVEKVVLVSRAVGPVERLYNWVRGSRSWESMILLKGRSWEEEWQKFKASRFGDELSIEATYEYFVGEEKKRRIIVKLKRNAVNFNNRHKRPDKTKDRKRKPQKDRKEFVHSRNNTKRGKYS